MVFRVSVKASKMIDLTLGVKSQEVNSRFRVLFSAYGTEFKFRFRLQGFEGHCKGLVLQIC